MATLWFGGKVRTLQNETDLKEAIFTDNGKIVAIGKEEDLRKKFSKKIQRQIDLNGATIYPGFVDSHLHVIGHGQKLLRLDVSDVTSLNELKRLLKQKLNQTDDGDWLLAEGFNENLFAEKEVPRKEFLDEISTSIPIMISRICRHAIVVNSYALRLAAITKGTFDVEGGLIERDDDGHPTGYLHDQAQELIKTVLPPINFVSIEKSLKTAVEDMVSKGLTGAHTEDLAYYGNPQETLRVFNRVIGDKNIKFRAHLLVHHEAVDEIEAMKVINSPFVELGAMKIFADGALGGRTALLSEPYADDPKTSGVAIHEQKQLDDLVAKARKNEKAVAIHAIGDLGLSQAISAIERSPSNNLLPDRLIHLQVVQPQDLDRLKKLHVIVDIQPRFVASDFPWVIDRLGEERASRSFAWKTYLKEGLLCAGGSDAPIEPVDPLKGIHAAVTRRKPFESHDGYFPSEKLSLYEALQLWTNGSAMAINRENERGLIKEGYDADFTILNEDLFELEPDEWLTVKVEKTVVDETVVYERDAVAIF